MRSYPTLFASLRRHRRLLSLVVLAALAVALALFLGRCLTAPSETSMTMSARDGGQLPIPCPEHCAGEASTADNGAPGLVTPNNAASPWIAGVFFAVLILLAAPSNSPVPPRPVLPKRPRALKFYALRI